MRLNTEARIAKLEEALRRGSGDAYAAHRLVARPGDDEAQMISALIASGSAKLGDRFIVRRIVRPAVL
jgi:hypothetical protein